MENGAESVKIAVYGGLAGRGCSGASRRLARPSKPGRLSLGRGGGGGGGGGAGHGTPKPTTTGVSFASGRLWLSPDKTRTTSTGDTSGRDGRTPDASWTGRGCLPLLRLLLPDAPPLANKRAAAGLGEEDTPARRPQQHPAVFDSWPTGGGERAAAQPAGRRRRFLFPISRLFLACAGKNTWTGLADVVTEAARGYS
ncbi:hypothetical protein BM221_009306 [Beauveria bassiana]|uniref:Uncharacterized protein n=1 Tax=Beauveria bassiana TaxID=176275 RepID=A0A2N6NCW4_BEABA|nr:hypothetical protein BM221_009306 [Beauveria bassiana]